WWLRAGQGDQACFRPAIQRALPAGSVLLLAVQRRPQALLDEALADSFHGADIDLQRFGNAGIGPSRAFEPGIRFEQDAGMDDLLGRGLFGGDQALQGVTFLSGERDYVLFHGGILWVPPQTIAAAAPGKSKVSGY